MRPRLARLSALFALLILSACATPSIDSGFDINAFTSVPASDTEARLRLPPGVDLNGPLFLVLREGQLNEEGARSETFEMKRVAGPFKTQSGSVALSYSLLSKDYGRYDRSRKRLVTRISANETASISIQYRLCRRAGVRVSPPYVVGFLLVSETNIPIYLVEAAVPADVAQNELQFCI